jgi:hypothetical protein
MQFLRRLKRDGSVAVALAAFFAFFTAFFAFFLAFSVSVLVRQSQAPDALE